MTIDMKGLDKPCTCGSKKMAGACCRKNESCPCGSGNKAGECCTKTTETKTKKK